MSQDPNTCSTKRTTTTTRTTSTTLKKYKGLNPDEAWDTVKALMDEVTAVGGTFSCIFHNQNLSEDFGWEGWRTLYERTLDYGQKIKTESKSPENH